MLSLSDTRLASQAKRMNQSLRRLESSNMTQQSRAYRNVLDQYYSGRYGSLFGVTGGGELKFRTDIGHMTESQKKELKKLMDQFEKSGTRKVGDIRKRNAAVSKEISDRYGEEISPEEVGKLYSSQSFTDFVDYYGSNFAWEIYMTMTAQEVTQRDILWFMTNNIGRGVYEIRDTMEEVTMINYDEEIDPDTRREMLNDIFDRFRYPDDLY